MFTFNSSVRRFRSLAADFHFTKEEVKRGERWITEQDFTPEEAVFELNAQRNHVSAAAEDAAWSERGIRPWGHG